MKKKIIIISIFIIVITSIILIIILNKGNNNGYSKELQELINTKVERNEFIGITYSKNIDENTVDSIEINVDELRLKKYVGNSEAIHIDEYKITESDINDLKDYIDKYNLPAWTNLPVENIDVVDQDKETIVLIYNNSDENPYEFYIIDINKGIKEEYYDYLIKFRKKIESLIKEENKTISYDENKQSNE